MSKFRSSAVLSIEAEIAHLELQVERLRAEISKKEDALYSAQNKEATAWVKSNCYPSRNIKQTILAMLNNFGGMERKQMAHILVESGKYTPGTAYAHTTKSILSQDEINSASN